MVHRAAPLSALALAVLALPAAAEEPPPPPAPPTRLEVRCDTQGRVSADFDGASLADALLRVAEAPTLSAGLAIDPETLADLRDLRVTARFRGVSPRALLWSLLTLHGIPATERDGVLIVGGDGAQRAEREGELERLRVEVELAKLRAKLRSLRRRARDDDDGARDDDDDADDDARERRDLRDREPERDRDRPDDAPSPGEREDHGARDAAPAEPSAPDAAGDPGVRAGQRYVFRLEGGREAMAWEVIAVEPAGGVRYRVLVSVDGAWTPAAEQLWPPQQVPLPPGRTPYQAGAARLTCATVQSGAGSAAWLRVAHERVTFPGVVRLERDGARKLELTRIEGP